MFESIRKHTKLMMILLFLVTIPAFVLVGVDGFKSITAKGPAVAEVGRRSITQAEWDQAHKLEADRLRASMPNLDPKLLDSPAAKYATLERMVRDQVMGQATEDARLTTTDARLAAELLRIPGVRKADGSVDHAAYTRFLQSRGYGSAEGFEAQLRQDLALRQLEAGISGTAFASPALTEALLGAMYQRREVQVARFNAADYQSKVVVQQTDIEAYYQAQQAQFQQAESADIEYLVLDLEGVKKTISVPEGDLKTYYEQNVARLSGKEERRASHILVAAAKDASAEQRKAAKDKAQSLLAQVRKSPDGFAELARKNSDDSASAKAGGDLDFFARGAMVKPFEEAVFAMKKGETSDLVESDFGYHIIRLTDLKVPKTKTLEELRPSIEADLRGQLAQRKYAEYAQAFTDGVFEQPDTLQGVADKLKLEVKTARVGRAPAPGAAGLLANPKLLDAVFSADAIGNKRNTDALDLGANQLVSARVVQHHPAQVLPLEQVHAKVRELLVASRAAELAKQDGQARLQQWQGGADAKLPAAVVVARDQMQNLEQPLVEAVLRADTGKLPTWVGVDLGARGYAVVRVNAVQSRARPGEEAAQREQARVAQWTAKAEADAYLEVLKKRMKVGMKVSAPGAGALAP
ncbi:MAG: SurA N-terminal domain-containing protein [Rhodoferax sp.]